MVRLRSSPRWHVAHDADCLMSHGMQVSIIRIARWNRFSRANFQGSKLTCNSLILLSFSMASTDHDASSGLPNTRSQRMFLVVSEGLDSVCPHQTSFAHKDCTLCWYARRWSSIQPRRSCDDRLLVTVSFLVGTQKSSCTRCSSAFGTSRISVDQLCSARQQSWCTSS